MWRSKSGCSIHLDVCLRVPQRSASTISSQVIKTPKDSSILKNTNEHCRKMFEQFAKQNNMSPTDWYQLSSASFDEKTRRLIAKQFNNSLYRALSAAFPEIEWKPWKFQHHNRVPNTYWKEQSNQRKFFDDLGIKLGIKTLDDWYEKLSGKEIMDFGGSGILTLHNFSPASALISAYPEHNWKTWKLPLTSGYWDNKSNQKMFFDDLAKHLGVEKTDDWYEKLSKKEIIQHGGESMLVRYDYSPIAALMATYPEHNWIPWKFNSVPKGFWNDKTNQRKFFDDLGKHLGVEKMDDWYSKVSREAIEKHGGAGLLRNQYNTSYMTAIMTVYPEHNWSPWKFAASSSPGFWDSKDNVRKFLNDLAEKLSIQTLDDWYRVDKRLLNQFGAFTLLLKYKGLYNILKEQYPHHHWDPKKFKISKKTQRWLAVTLKKIFPNEEIVEDFLHPQAVFEISKRPMQLDIYIPSKSLAFEYQGEQHYQHIGIFSSTAGYQRRDEEKRALCAANNIKLIEVPYWWNRTQQELEEIIAQQSTRPNSVTHQ